MDRPFFAATAPYVLQNLYIFLIWVSTSENRSVQLQRTLLITFKQLSHSWHEIMVDSFLEQVPPDLSSLAVSVLLVERQTYWDWKHKCPTM
jgi:hypothetical protein